MILAQVTIDLAVLERMALAGGAPASIIVLLIVVQALVIKLVPDRRLRVPLVYGICAIQGLAALTWLGLSVYKSIGG